jgi:hypothetical protein
MTTTEADWANKLAASIIEEYRKYGDQPGFPIMLASRLRIERDYWRTDGVIDGLNRAICGMLGSLAIKGERA